MLKDTHVFHGNTILTQNPKAPRAFALAIADGRIRAVGTQRDVETAVGQDSRKTHFTSGVILPAFNDAHIHIWKVGDLLTYMLDLRGVRSIAEMQDKLADFAKQNPQNEWILARGFNEALFEDGQMPSRYDLDKVIPDRPCHVIRTCAHIVVVNTKVMNLSGITAQTPVPSGGEIRRDTEGVPNGILSETALGLVKKHIPAYSTEQYRNMILAAQDALLKVGIASATDPAVHPELLEVYKMMEKAGELKVRINAVPIRVPDGATEALPLPELYDSAFLTINTVKFFADGGLSGKTSALKHPYRNSTDKGVLRLDENWFKKLAQESQDAGFKIASHAIGDAAIDMVLNVYENLSKTNSRNLRHRVEHLGLPELSHLIRMQKMGIHAVPQPIFIYELGRNFRQYLPDFYLENVYPFRSMLDAGLTVAFSSDAPVVRDFNPLMGIRNAAERIDDAGNPIAKHQALSVEEALAAYTLGAACANGKDAELGSLEVGKKADFIVLDKNPVETPISEISDIRVLQTWVGGKKVFD